MTLKNWDSNEFFPYLCTLDTLLLFVDFLEYFWAHYTLEDHSFPKFHCVRIDMKIVYHCPIQHLTSRLKCIPLNWVILIEGYKILLLLNTNVQVIHKLINVPVKTPIYIPNQIEIKRTKKTLTKLVVRTRHIGIHFEDFLRVKLQK